MVLHREAAQVAVVGGDGGFEEDQERVLPVIDVVDREVESCLELGGLLDGPIHRDVEPVVGVDTVFVAVAEFGDHGAHVEVVAERHGHRVARLVNP